MADEDDFKKAVYDACTCFGNQDWPNLEDMLHHHVVMKRIDDPEAFHLGKRAVIDYFYNNGQKDKARFAYDLNEISCLVAKGRIGVASGQGTFWPTADAKPRSIAFSFAFLKINQKWLAINLWGAYAD
jgi:hypothetical protein